MRREITTIALAATVAACAGFAERFEAGMAEARTRPPGGVYLPVVDPKVGTGNYDVDATECNAIANAALSRDYGIDAAVARHRAAVSRCMSGRGYSVLN